MDVKFTNNGHSTLAASVATSDTSITVASGHGARFPSLSGSAYFFVTLIDASNNLEIVKCTARSSDVLTITRAQESTTARAFAIGDRIELRVTAAGLGAIYSEAVADATPAADSIVNSMIATDAVNADSIAANAVGASELNVSGNGSSGQVLASDADGTFSWTTVSADTPNYSFAQLNGTPSFSAAQSTYQDSGLSVTITPQYTSSRILIICQFVMRSDSTGADGNGRVLRSIGGGSYADINVNTSPVSGSEAGAVAGNLRDAISNHGYLTTWHTLDHPNTTSACTYKLQVIGEANFQLNRGTQGGAIRFGSPPAMITVLEVLD